MKKRIIGIALAVVLVAGGLGGLAYAQVNGHQPMTGQKLVGVGQLGHVDYDWGWMRLWSWTPAPLTIRES